MMQSRISDSRQLWMFADNPIDLFAHLAHSKITLLSEDQFYVTPDTNLRFLQECLGYIPSRGIHINTLPFGIPVTTFEKLMKIPHFLAKIIGYDYSEQTARCGDEHQNLAILISMLLIQREPPPSIWDHMDLKNPSHLQERIGLKIYRYMHNSVECYLISSSNCPWEIIIINPLHLAYVLRCNANASEDASRWTVFHVARLLLKYLIPFVIIAPFDSTKHRYINSIWNEAQWKLDNGMTLGLGRRGSGTEYTTADREVANTIAQKVLMQPHAAAAFQHGGPLARIAASLINIDTILKGPSDNATGRVFIRNTQYVYDELTEQEIYAIVGVYRVLSRKE